VALALYAQGRTGLPHGSCSGVAIAEHALYGGYEYTSKKWVLTLDHIVALKIILENGTQIHKTETFYPDIFIATRGAGDSFGVVTYPYLKTEAGLRPSLNGVDTILCAFQSLQNCILTSPDVISTSNSACTPTATVL
jgi:predicted alternative tryptophan synthase beta-subunit